MGNIVVARVNEAKLISGCRGEYVVIGNCKFVFWGCEKSNTLPLDLIRLEVKTVEAETVQGVRVSIDGVVCVKISAWTVDNGNAQAMDRGGDDEGAAPEDQKISVDQSQVILAAQHFLGKSRQDLVETLTRVLEGHQRQILGTLVVDDLYKNRTEFIMKVRHIAEPDLKRMGFELVSYTLATLSDEGGYLDCLGQTQLAKVKREALEGTSKEENITKIKICENESQSRIKVAEQNQRAEITEAEYDAQSHTAVARQQTIKQSADCDVKMRRAQIDTEIARERAIARQAGVIEKESQQKLVVVKVAEQQEERTRIEIRIEEEEAKKNAMIEQGKVEVAEIDARRIAVIAAGKVKVAEETARMIGVEAQGRSTAELVVAENEAKAEIASADGQAKATLAVGEAGANATRMKGEAVAASLSAKLEAETSAIVRKYKEMGQAGVLSELFPYLPAIAGAISEPLCQTDKMTFITSDGSSGTKATNEVCTMLAQVPEAVETVSGINLKGVMKNMVEREARGAPPRGA